MKIGYRNILIESSVTASSEQAGFEKENAYDGTTGGYWKPVSVPAHLKAAGHMPLGMWMGDTTPGTVTSSQLVIGGDMATTNDWTPLNANLSIVGGALRLTSIVGGVASFYQLIQTVPNKSIKLTANLIFASMSGGISISAGTLPNNQSYGLYYDAAPAFTTHEFIFTPTGTDTYIVISGTSSMLQGEFMDWDDVSILGDGIDDLTTNNNGLFVYGGLLKTTISSGAGIVEYSGFSPADYLEQTYNPSMEFALGDFSIVGWVRADNNWPSQIETLVDRGNTAFGGRFGLYIDVTAQLRYQSDQTVISGGPVLADGNFHFVAAVRRSGIVYLYVDGALVHSGVDTSNQVAPGETLRFGVDQDGARPLSDGYLSLWSVDGVGITSGEVKDFYDKERHFFVKGGTLPQTLLSTRATTADYFAIYDHDFALTGSSIVLQYSDDDILWADAFDPIYPSTSSPIFKTFTQSSHEFWRVYIDGNVQSIGVCMFGLRLDFNNGLTFGFAPPALAQQFMSRTNTSSEGEFIGRSVYKKPISGDLIFNPTFSRAWVRQFWPELIRHMERKPFFVFPEDDYPEECLFCWADQIRGPANPSTFMSLQIPVKAKAS